MFKVKNEVVGTNVKTATLSFNSGYKFNNNTCMLHMQRDDPSMHSLNLQAHITDDNIAIMFSIATKVWENSSMHTLNLMGSTKTEQLNIILTGPGIKVKGNATSFTIEKSECISKLKHYIEIICTHSGGDSKQIDAAAVKPFLEKFADIVKFHGDVNHDNNATMLDKILQLFKCEADLIVQLSNFSKII